MPNVKISVVMCTYNGSEFLIQQLDSIVLQTLPPNEIVVIDDESQDGTWDILNKYSHDHEGIFFRVEKNKKNLGYIENFLKAINIANGDIIFLADQDDLWYPTKISDMVSVFEKYEDAFAVNCAYDLIDASGRKISNKLSVHQSNNNVSKKISWEKYILSPRYPGMSLAIKRDLINYIPQIQPDKIPAHDWILNQTAAYLGGMYYYGKILTGYRQHNSNSVGAIKGDTAEDLIENRISVIDFLSRTHQALKLMYPDNDSIQNWIKELENLDNIRMDNIKNKHLLRCLYTYLRNLHNMTIRCFMGDSYTILKLKRQ